MIINNCTTHITPNTTTTTATVRLLALNRIIVHIQVCDDLGQRALDYFSVAAVAAVVTAAAAAAAAIANGIFSWYSTTVTAAAEW
eukprot:11882-Heterococcus_DN1.PRE.1